MSVFEYVTALLAIVLGLSIARVMSGIGAFIVADKRVFHDWIVVGWCVALTMCQIGWWMLIWIILSQSEAVLFGTILTWIGATAMLFLASYVLIPGTGVSLGSPAASMGSLRSAFFVCLALHFLIPFLNAVSDGTMEPGLLLVLLMVVLSGAGVFVNGDRAHVALLVVWLVAMSVLNYLAVPGLGENIESIAQPIPQ